MSKQQELKEKVQKKRENDNSQPSKEEPIIIRTSDEVRQQIKNLKKAHNKKWQKLFGTKRPSAGVVRRHFLNLN